MHEAQKKDDHNALPPNHSPTWPFSFAHTRAGAEHAGPDSVARSLHLGNATALDTLCSPSRGKRARQFCSVCTSCTACGRTDIPCGAACDHGHAAHRAR